MSLIAKRFERAKQRIRVAALNCGRNPEDIKLVVVSKSQPLNSIEEAIAAGATDFGESRWQEARVKWSILLKHAPNITLHFIGPLQSNKLSSIAALFHVIHSISSASHLERLHKIKEKQSFLPQLLLQVNIGEEPQKSGISPEQIKELLQQAAVRGIDLEGFMAIPPHQQASESFFSSLSSLASFYKLPIVSMGMSEDFEQAIKHGATIVRLGKAIFEDSFLD